MECRGLNVVNGRRAAGCLSWAFSRGCDERPPEARGEAGPEQAQRTTGAQAPVFAMMCGGRTGTH